MNNLKGNQVMVFPANLAGIIGKGLAQKAARLGAEPGGTGRMGNTYGLVLRGHRMEPLELPEIGRNVAQFLAHAWKNPDAEFVVPDMFQNIGKLTDIANMFRERPDNIVLPGSIINKLV